MTGGQQDGVTREDWAELEAQMHELEVLMEETEAPPALFGTYMQLSVDLLALLEEMSTLMPAVRAHLLDARTERQRYLAVRQRLMNLQAGAQVIMMDSEELGGLEG